MADVICIYKAAKQFDEVAVQLYGCTTTEKITEIFSGNKIEDTKDKTALLQQCMGIEEYFDSTNDNLPVVAEDEYEYAISVFLEGSWRILSNG